MKSLYICFPEANKIEVRDEEVTGPQDGEVLCQATKSLISTGTESYCLRGVFDPGTNWAAWVRYPFRPGYSMAARVVEVGSGVRDLRVGDRVMASVAHQQFFGVKAERALRIPDGVSDEEATWGPLASTTQLAVRRAQLQLGESVAVVGLGILGQLVTQYAFLSGCRMIVAIDMVERRLEQASAHGATHVLKTDVATALVAVDKMTRGRMLDLVWDVTGHPAVLAPALQLLHQFGRLVLVGDTPTPTQQHLGPGVVSNSLSILGIHGRASAPSYSDFTPWPSREIISLFFDYVLQDRMRVDDLVTHRFSPLDAPSVYADLQVNRPAYLGVIYEWPAG